MRPRALLINPWIYDFAAFDLWAKPLGLLYLAAWLQRAGFEVRLVDCLDRLHPRSGARPRRPAWAPGTGQWARRVVSTPKPLRGIPRSFARYGLSEAVFVHDISAGARPDLVLVTSSMTYWYPGVQQAISLVREAWPGSPVILGGTYATLCREHALENSGADIVVSGPGEGRLPDIISEILGEPPAAGAADPTWRPDIWPALDLYPRFDFAPLLTSRGCPGRCPYCASRLLFRDFIQRRPDDILAEIEDRRYRLGLRDFAFFDDALLVGAETRLIPLLEGVLSRGLDLRFHVPNGLHVDLITPGLARLMFAAGFRTLRLGLESLDPDRQSVLGEKVGAGNFESALSNLFAAGFSPERIGAYILFGLPGQPLDEVMATAQAVKALGVRPYLAEFSPLPGTALWDEARRRSRFDLAAEPLYHNNTFFPCRTKGYTWEKIWEIKRAANA